MKKTTQPKRKVAQAKFYILATVYITFLFSLWFMFHSSTAESLPRKTVQLEIGKAQTVDLPHDIADVLVANPGVANVGVLRTNRLYFVGQSIGDTNILTFDENGNLLAEIQVHVRMNQSVLQKTLNDFFPEEKITVRTVGDDVVLSGVVSNASMANQVRDLATRFLPEDDQTIVDLMSVDGERQVMLRVKIVEASRSILNELGINADYKAANVGAGAGGGAFNGALGVGLTDAATGPFGTGSITFEDGQGFGPLSISLTALERDGYVNTLAEPNLTAISGELASFLVGGRFPVPVSRDQDGNVLVEFEDFGVSLNFRPVVLSSNRINLQLSTEVSTLAPQDGLSIPGIDIPAFQVRKAETTVEMSSGGTLMIAGLIQSDATNALNQMPGAGDIPILGELFKSKSFARDETELLIIISPMLVKPFKEAQADIVAEEKPSKPQQTPLEKAFLKNMRRIYGDKNLQEDLVEGQVFGYMID